MFISSEAELFEVKSDWNSDNFTWTGFGNCSLPDIEAIKLFWFPENPIARGRIHDIWKRHPQQQQQQRQQQQPQEVQQPSSTSMFNWLSQRSGESVLTNDEQLLFWTKFEVYGIPLKERLLSVQDSRHLVKSIRSFLRSNTALMMQKEGYIFGQLLEQAGGKRALIYRVIDAQKSTLFCGKVYSVDADNKQTIAVEINSSQQLHENGIHPHIVHYLDTKSFAHSTAPFREMIVLIMPMYPLSLSTLLDALMESPMTIEMFQILTKSLLSACSRFEEVNKCHCDVKPENIMVGNGTFILIDLGAVTDINGILRECTDGYYLDASIYCVQSIFDLNCIAVTLGRCCIKDFQVIRGRTRAMYLEMLDKQDMIHRYKDIIRICLTSTSCKDALESFRRLVDA